MKKIFAFLAIFQLAYSLALGAPFSDEQKRQLLQDCEKEIGIALTIAHQNQTIESTFRVMIFLLTIGVATTSVIIAAHGARPKHPLTIANAILAAIISASSAFAFTQFDFGTQRRVWQNKADAFAVLRDEVKYSDPEPSAFLAKMEAARRIDKDNKTPENNRQ
jgi:hypothetical protein